MFSYVLQSQQSRRSPAGFAISFTLHLAGFAGALSVALTDQSILPLAKSALTFVHLSPASAVPAHLPRATPAVPHRIVTDTSETTPPRETESLVQPLPEMLQTKVLSTSHEPSPRELSTRLELSRSMRATVSVGAFPNTPIKVHAAEQTGHVQSTGFDAPAARAPELKFGSTAVGAFERPAAGNDPQPGSDQPAGRVIADVGFGSTGSAPAASAAPRTLGSPGFDTTNNQDGRARRSNSTPAEVERSGFSDDRPSSRSPRPSSRSEPVNVSAEVISRPAPTYTNEARALKIEGDVLLEVQLCATGQVRVLRVVRGLGHGLDEAATHAAERIQFKPAQNSSGPVDVRTIIHITFRLT